MGSTTVPFRDVLRRGSTGTQPVAVKRGLWHAGFKAGWDSLGSDEIAAEVLGTLAVANLQTFQRYHGLPVDGVYGPASHKILQGSFDAYARKLYQHDPPPSSNLLQLPENFVPTHATAGLPGYPAIDNFAAAGTPVGAPAPGRVRRLSGKDPDAPSTPHFAYGWSIYLQTEHADYYLTHFGTRTVKVGDWVNRGDIIGTVCDARKNGLSSSLSHIHEGKKTL